MIDRSLFGQEHGRRYRETELWRRTTEIWPHYDTYGIPVVVVEPL